MCVSFVTRFLFSHAQLAGQSLTYDLEILDVYEHKETSDSGYSLQALDVQAMQEEVAK